MSLPARCRDRRQQPFASHSIWNTAIGSSAVLLAANLYHDTTPLHGARAGDTTPLHGADLCAAGRFDPSQRLVCATWQPGWNGTDCVQAGCCYDEHPLPDPMHLPWCYAKAGDMRPEAFYVDTDYFVATTASDPLATFVDQGWWGDGDQRWGGRCGIDHCCLEGRAVGSIPFPTDRLVTQTGNNAAAVLLPDQVTLLQFQPLYRCTAGGPLTSLASFLHTPWANVSILSADNSSYGAHGGSHLSSIGGTIRRGELLPTSPRIPHALKLMLWGKRYYWPGNQTEPCFRWPAENCDGVWNASRNASDVNFYNGTNPKLKPGALLAVPQGLSKALARQLATPIASKLLQALTDYGGYLDDNTASDTGAFNVEGGVETEVAAHYAGLSLRPKPGQALYVDLLAIYRHLHIVDNNGPDSVGGGGEPRRPPAPPICPD